MEFTKALSQHSNILHSSVMKQKERELDLLSFYVLFSHCRHCDVTLQIIQILHYPSAFACRDNGKFSFESLGGLNTLFSRTPYCTLFTPGLPKILHNHCYYFLGIRVVPLPLNRRPWLCSFIFLGGGGVGVTRCIMDLCENGD